MTDTAKIKPFDGNTDFAMWQVKMKAILIREKCWRAITQNFPENTKEEEKEELNQITHSEIMLRLTDEVG